MADEEKKQKKKKAVIDQYIPNPGMPYTCFRLLEQGDIVIIGAVHPKTSCNVNKEVAFAIANRATCELNTSVYVLGAVDAFMISVHKSSVARAYDVLQKFLDVGFACTIGDGTGVVFRPDNAVDRKLTVCPRTQELLLIYELTNRLSTAGDLSTYVGKVPIHRSAFWTCSLGQNFAQAYRKGGFADADDNTRRLYARKYVDAGALPDGKLEGLELPGEWFAESNDTAAVAARGGRLFLASKSLPPASILSEMA